MLKRELMWPTPIYHKDFADSKNLNKHLFKLIKAWSKKDPTMEKTNSGGGWHSPTNMNEKPEYRKALTPLSLLPLFSQDHKLKGFKKFKLIDSFKPDEIIASPTVKFNFSDL